MIQKLLIANRGEIAVRIIRACREMGIRTVAVYSEADQDAMHVKLADEAVCIGPAPAKDSYLNMEAIISAAIVTGADALHPGFGFLSENAGFVKHLEDCNITFVGPDSETIARLGNKAMARRIMSEEGVPVIPGCDRMLTDPVKARRIARKIGFPVIIKAALGGGGKGMRVVDSEEEFEERFRMAQKESEMAFGDGRMYLEHFVENPKHIEFQILADNSGNIVHLGERDCSIQRNHQKVIEEAPGTALSESLRAKMGKMAVRAAKAAGYTSAGTIEFLLEKNQKFYFMEMNTRIQVEHPVTEWVTGVDLIKEQLRIASGEKLSFSQKDVKIQGHAIECRIHAEDPEKHFQPCPGTIGRICLPGGNGIRIDSAIYNGCRVSPYYDSMLAKVIVHAGDREEAISRMQGALAEIQVDGVTTNTDFLRRIVGREDYRNGYITISYLDDIQKEGTEAW